MKKRSLAILFVFTILASSVAYTMTWNCIDIMRCTICALFDDNGNKIGDYVTCHLVE